MDEKVGKSETQTVNPILNLVEARGARPFGAGACLHRQISEAASWLRRRSAAVLRSLAVLLRGWRCTTAPPLLLRGDGG